MTCLHTFCKLSVSFLYDKDHYLTKKSKKRHDRDHQKKDNIRNANSQNEVPHVFFKGNEKKWKEMKGNEMEWKEMKGNEKKWKELKGNERKCTEMKGNAFVQASNAFVQLQNAFVWPKMPSFTERRHFQKFNFKVEHGPPLNFKKWISEKFNLKLSAARA